MGLFDVFSKKKYLQKVQLETVIEQLAFLAKAMENNTDKASDIKYWKECIEKLDSFEHSKAYDLQHVKEVNHILYDNFLSRHFSI